MNICEAQTRYDNQLPDENNYCEKCENKTDDLFRIKSHFRHWSVCEYCLDRIEQYEDDHE